MVRVANFLEPFFFIEDDYKLVKREQKVEVSDTTKLNSNNKACHQNILIRTT